MTAHRHDHDHSHGHDGHDHHHGEDGRPVGLGPAVLDIGGDIGALVATMPSRSVGTELYLRPEDNPSTTVHTGVWERHHAGPGVTAAVFLELRQGTYQVLDEHGAPVRAIEIVGGEVATIDLRN
jgi:hypothetical protein